MGAVKHSSTAANAAPTTKLAHEMNEEIFFTLWWLFSPSATEIIALPPMPNMLANAISRMKIGLVRLTAATCRACSISVALEGRRPNPCSMSRCTSGRFWLSIKI